MLNSKGWEWISMSYFLMLGKKIQSFMLKFDAGNSFFVDACFHAEKVSFHSDCWQFLSGMDVWLLNAFFFCIYSDGRVFFSSLICWIILVDVQILNQLRIPGINPIWSWFHWLKNLLTIFASMFMRHTGLKFYFLIISYLVLVSGQLVFHRIVWEIFFSLNDFGRVCLELIFFPWKFGRILQWVTGA